MGDFQERLEKDGHNDVEDDGHGAHPLGHGDLCHARLEGQHEHHHACQKRRIFFIFFCRAILDTIFFKKMRWAISGPSNEI